MGTLRIAVILVLMDITLSISLSNIYKALDDIADELRKRK